MAIPSEECVCEYEGPVRNKNGFGWNWFVPSPRALARWMEDAGFEDVESGDGVHDFAVTTGADPLGQNRCLAVGSKRAGHKISTAGLSQKIL
ncbi:MAG: hypothetical protein ABI165_17265 [Bryobacteraceae bacterium]